MPTPDEHETLHAAVKPKDLQALSIDELEDYIASLESEIARADAAIAQKQKHRSGIDALFGGTTES